MDHRLLLVKSITLLYRESQLPNLTENSSSLINDIVSLIKPAEGMIGDFGKDAITSLRETAKWMAGLPLNHVYDKSELLQRIRVNVGNEENLFDAFKDSIQEDLGETELKKACQSYKDALRLFLNQSRVKELLKNHSLRVNFHEDSVDWRHFVPTLIDELEPYKNILDTKSIQHASVVDDIDFNDLSTINKIFQRGVEELDNNGIIRFGWQGLNRMFGSQGGARRGEMIVIGALQHNFKSGMTLEMFKSAALYNKPYMRDPTKKPMLMRISFENPLTTDITYLYKSLVENETGLPVDIRSVSPHEAASYVAERLQANGYRISMAHIDPTDYTHFDLFDRITKLEADGYEVQLLELDYLNMMSKRGCASGAQGMDIRDLFRRVRNFTSKRGITCITPHQLSTEAKQLIRLGSDNFVQEIANKGYYDSCRTIDQEVDMEIYIHIVKVNDISYLTVQRGKHRKIAITNPRDLYTVYRFEEVGGIKDDINGRDNSRKAVGGATIADGGDPAWFTGI